MTVVSTLLWLMPLKQAACAANANVTTTISEAAAVPLLCPPYNSDGVVVAPATPESCAADGFTPLSQSRTALQPLVCTTADIALTSDETEDRKRCTIVGKLLMQPEFTDLMDKVEAVNVRPSVWLPRVHQGCSV